MKPSISPHNQQHSIWLYQPKSKAAPHYIDTNHSISTNRRHPPHHHSIMIPTSIHQGEPLHSYLHRKSRNFLFNPAKKAQAEKARSAREATNSAESGLLQLPGELRNQIYDLLLPNNWEIKRSQYHTSKGHIPSLLHVCRRLRQETYHLFFARNRVVITLQHLTQHPRALQRIQSSINLLPSAGTLEWRRLRIESCSRCFHSDGFAVLSNIDILIDRETGTVIYQPRVTTYLSGCCRAAQREFSQRLLAEIKSRGFHDGSKRLRRSQFERLAVTMDENRQDWLKSSKRVIPQGRWG